MTVGELVSVLLEIAETDCIVDMIWKKKFFVNEKMYERMYE